MANIALSSSMIATSTIVQRQAQLSFPITFPLAFNIPNLMNGLSGSATIVAISNLTGQLINIIPISGNISAMTSLQGNIKNALALQNTGLIGSVTIGLTSITSKVVVGGQLSSASSLLNAMISNAQRVVSSVSSASTISGNASVNGAIAGTIYAVSNLPPAIIVGTVSLTNQIIGFSEDWNTQPYAAYNTVVNSVNGVLNVTSTNGDPMIFMTGIGSWDPDIYRFIDVRYRLPAGSPATTFQIFFTNTVYPTVTSEAQHVTYSGALIADDVWHTATLDMWTGPNYRTGGNITGWRYDWATASGVTMDIDYIQLASIVAIATSMASGTITSRVTLSGQLSSVSFLPNATVSNLISASSSVFSVSTVSATIKSNLAIASSIFAISSLPPPIVTPKVALNGQISASSTITAQIANKMGSVPQLIAVISTISGNPAATFILGANNVTSTSLTGIIADQVNIQGNVTGSSALTANIVKNVSLSSSAVGATSFINATISASFGSIGTVHASTAINSIIIVQQALQGNLIISSTLTTGTINNLISSFLNLTSNITISQTFTFPWSFPFAINDLVKSTAAISGTVTAVSSMTNNGIVRTIAATLQAPSSITGKLTCTLSPQGTVSSSSVIGPSSIAAKLALSGQLPATPAMTGQVTGQVNVTSQSIAAISTASGNLTVSFAPTTNVVANTSIVGAIAKRQNVQGSVVVSSSLTASMEQVVGLVSAIQATVSISDAAITATPAISGSVNAIATSSATSLMQVSCQGIIGSTSSIAGSLYNLISGSVSSTGSISLPQTITFPLGFPLVFNDGAMKSVAIDGAITATSSITGSMVQAISTTIQAKSLVDGTIKSTLNLQGTVTVASNITATTTKNIALAGTIQSHATIANTTITAIVPLSTGFLSNSSINGTVGNAIGIDGQVIADSTLQATLNKVYLITLPATFAPNVSVTVIARFSNSISTLFANLLSAVLLQPTILEIGEMQSNQQIRGIFDCEQIFEVVPYEVSATAAMDQGVPEIVTFEANIGSPQMLNLSQFSNAQFVNIPITAKI